MPRCATLRATAIQKSPNKLSCLLSALPHAALLLLYEHSLLTTTGVHSNR
jgi:hypothetical protein